MSLQNLTVPILDAQFKSLNVEGAVKFGSLEVQNFVQLDIADGGEEVINCPIQNGQREAQDYLVVAPWSATEAYPQGSIVSNGGSNWYKQSAGLSTVGVAPVAGVDWSQKSAGSSYSASTITKDTLNCPLSGPQLYFNSNPQGVGLQSGWLDVAPVVGPPAIPAYSEHNLIINRSLSINAPAPVAATAGFDAVLNLEATSLAAGNPSTTFTFYNGVGNPGGGAPANQLSLYGYPSGGGVVLLATTTPAVDIAGPPAVPYGSSLANPALFQLTAPQQSGRVNIPTGQANAVLAIAGSTSQTIIFTQVLGVADAVGSTTQVAPLVADGTLTSVIPDTRVAGTITLTGNANATNANGVIVEWFIVHF